MRHQLRVFVVALGVVVAGTGCSAINDFGRFMFGDVDGGADDGGTADSGVDSGVDSGGIDAGPDVDAGIDAGPRGPTSIVQTSGGAVIQTSEYRLRVSIGAPQPMGSASNSGNTLRVGPQAR
jgi:hypothetical protein